VGWGYGLAFLHALGGVQVVVISNSLRNIKRFLNEREDVVFIGSYPMRIIMHDADLLYTHSLQMTY
jgi:hypothetical protein